jgi:hypothetical protein
MVARLMGLKTVSPGTLHRLVQGAGRVPGARDLDPAGFKDGDLPLDKNDMLVFYCPIRCS